MWFFFEMCFHFQNVKGFVSVVFPFSKKTQLSTKIRTFRTNSFTDKIVNKQLNIHKAFKFVSVVKNLLFITSDMIYLHICTPTPSSFR